MCCELSHILRHMKMLFHLTLSLKKDIIVVVLVTHVDRLSLHYICTSSIAFVASVLMCHCKTVSSGPGPGPGGAARRAWGPGPAPGEAPPTATPGRTASSPVR